MIKTLVEKYAKLNTLVDPSDTQESCTYPTKNKKYTKYFKTNEKNGGKKIKKEMVPSPKK